MKKSIALLLALMLGVTLLAGCGGNTPSGETSNPTGTTSTPGETQGTETTSSPTETEAPNGLERFSKFGKDDLVAVYYPADKFTEMSAGLPAIKKTDSGVIVRPILNYNVDFEENSRRAKKNYGEQAEYSEEDITVAGFEAQKIVYQKEGDYLANYYIKFGEKIGDYGAIEIVVVADEFEKLNDPDIIAVVNSLKVEK